MSLEDEIIDVGSDFVTLDEDYGIFDRGEMYLRVHELTNSSSSIIEGSIATFSGFIGGAAYLANYVLADQSEFSSTSYDSYSMRPVDGSNDIYKMSQNVADDYYELVLSDVSNNGGSGDISASEGIDAASETWTSNSLGNQFPGNFIGTIIENGSIGPIPLPSLSDSDGALAARAGAVGSILFGKSVEDFQGRSGYAIINGPDSNNEDFFGFQRYVLKYNNSHGGDPLPNGDRNGDGVVDYNDGIVVMVEAEAFALEGPNSTIFKDLLETYLGDIITLNSEIVPEGATSQLDWDSYRNWDLMRDFRAQLNEGEEYDFVVFAQQNGDGDEKDFWGYAETVLGDEVGLLRNFIFSLDRTQEGGSEDDFISSGRGDDTLKGGEGNDVLRGGWGQDTLEGGKGDDKLYGEAGDNIYIYNKYDGNDIIYDSDYSENDIIRFSPDISLADITLDFSGNDLIYNFSFGGSITIKDYQASSLEESEDKLDFGSLDLTPWVSNTIEGSIIDGTSSGDLISGSNGDDEIDGGAGADRLFGAYGDDRFIGIDNPSQTGLEGDTFDGGEGLDIVDYTAVDQFFIYGIHADLNAGFAKADASLTINTSDASGMTVYTSDFGVDPTMDTLISIEGVIGTVSTDYLIGNSDDNVLAGWKADDDFGFLDFIEGSAGNDFIHGGDPNTGDREYLDGDDVLIYSNLDTNLINQGSDGIIVDLITSTVDKGDLGTDTIISMEWFVGTALNDTFISGWGTGSSFDGGNGSDTYILTEGGENIIIGEDINASGIDVIEAAGVNPTTYAIMTTPNVGIKLAPIIADSTKPTIFINNLDGSAETPTNISVEFITDTNTGTSYSISQFSTITNRTSLAPQAQDDSFSVSQDTVFIDNLLFNDSDADSSFSLIAGTISTDQGGSVTFDTNGFFTYTPLTGFQGEDTFMYIIRDIAGSTDYGFVTLDVGLPNAAPVAEDDTFISPFNGVLTDNVLNDNGSGADSDEDGDALSITPGAFTTAQGGEVFFYASGDFMYNPAVGFTGTDTFTYTLLDEHGATDTGTVSVIVSSTNFTSGDDTISGGSGDDILYGGEGQDVHRGREGDDYFYASSGRDSYFGNISFFDDNGIDTLDYSFAPSGIIVSLGMGSTSGNASQDGFGYDDFAIANIENLVGTDFDDEIHGSKEDNNLKALDGDDFIAGYRGNDTLEGGSGNDTYYINFFDGHDVIIDSGGDNDVIEFSGSFIQSHIVLTDVNVNDVLITFTNSPDQSILLAGQRDTSSATQIETLLFSDGSEIGLLGQIGTLGDDILTGTASDDTLSGIDGADTLIGGDGDDILNGGRGNDTLDGGDGNDLLRGDGNDDILDAGNQDDILTGGQGNDELYGGMGNDILDGGFQNDFLDGGSEDDLLFGDRGNDTLIGGDGNDTLTGGLNTDVLEGGSGDDLFIYNMGDGADTISDSSGNDTLSLGAGFTLGNTRFSQSGDNLEISFLTNPGGSITLIDQREASGDYQIETVLFSNGYTLDIASVPIIGTAGNDTITGTSGTDFIEGRNGNDTISGGDGHDIISGEGGDDTLDAGLGDDIYIFRGSDGNDIISDAGGTDDSIILGPTIEQRDVEFNFTGSDLILSFSDAPSDSITISNQTGSGAIERLVFDTGEEFSTVSITGTTASDIIDGTYAGEFIFGLDGNDTINGNGGGDIIDGGVGDDIINGGAGDDDFIHSEGHDLLNGGDGIDRILVADGLTREDVTILRYFETPENLEILFSDGSSITIEDQFIGPREGAGHIELMEFSDGTSISLNDGTEYLIIGTDNRDVVSTSTILDRDQGYVVDPLDGNDFLFGGTKDDYFYGSLGNDTYIGGLGGSDTVDYSYALSGIIADFGQTSGAGSVTVDGFGGVDTVNGMDNVIGSSYDDIIYGNLFDNYIEGGAGNDTLEGFTGNDTIFGLDGDDIINGGDGNDHVVGGEGNDIVDGGAGDDIVNGGLGNDILIGGAGNDVLESYEGDDVFIGGEGDDTYIYRLGGGNDTIIDGDGNDTIILGAGIDYDNFEFDKVGDDLVIYLDETGDTFLTIQGHFEAGNEDLVETIITDDGVSHDITDPPVNDPPIGYDDVFTVDEDGFLTANVLLNDSDPDGDLLTVTPQSFTTSNGGTIELLANGDLNYTPAENFFGEESFIYVLSDGEYEDVATVTITVNPINDAPVAADDSFTVNEDTVLTGNVLSENGFGVDSDIEGDALSVVSAIITTAAGATVILNSDGSFEYTPALNVNGSDSFTYTLTDGDLTDTGQVFIDVLPVNDNPIAQDDSFDGFVTQSVSGNVLTDNGNGADYDVDGDGLSIISETIITDQGGTLELYSNGDFLYTPDLFFYGTDSMHYTLLDGQGGSDTGILTFSIALPPDTLFGSQEADVIKFAGDADTIHGLGGDDRLYGRGGDDLMFGGEGDDFLAGNAGSDLITGEAGDDTIRGGSGSDTLEGGDGNDSLFGGRDDDILSGGAGSDFLNGGEGADTFVFKDENDGSTDTIRGFDEGQGDALDLSAILEAYDPLNDAIEDFVQIFNEASGRTIVAVDEDGGGDDFTELVAIVAGNLTSDEQTLINNGTLII